MAFANITTWVGMGKPTTKVWSSSLRKYVYKLPNPPAGYSGWMCDAKAEIEASPANREAWFQVKSGCRSGYEKVAGLAYSPSLQGFVGTMVEPPKDAYVPTYTPPPVITNTPAPGSQPVQTSVTNVTNGGTMPIYPTSTNPDLLGAILGGVGGLITGGPLGAVAGALGGYATGGESPTSPGVLSGGYTGGSLASGCPTGWYWDGTQCREGGIMGTIHQVLPGGQTGTMPASGYGAGWTTTDTPFGAGYVPQSVTRSQLRCPPGYVLVGNRDGNSPGMEVCLPRGRASAFRKWKPGPKPLLSGGDMKTIRKADRLRKKVQRTAMKSGFTCKKR